jgi:PAS domain S-box-containing protein
LAEYHFWAALAHAGAAQDATAPAGRPHGLDKLRAHHKEFIAWADNGPRTSGDRAALVAAELARLEGRELDAERLYEQAVRSAREQGFVHNEALSHELAARFHRARGLETIADAYLRNARACYRRWGALGKLEQLDKLHLQAGEEQASPFQGGLAPLAELDIGTVLRASQAMSGEIVIDRLIEILMTTAVEQAGASRGTLVLRWEDTLRVEAEAEAGPRSVAVQLLQRTVTPEDVPDSLLRTAMRTRRNVIIDDAQRANPFGQDRYFQRRKPRSVLCLPLVTQVQMLGVLYLETDLTPGTFTAQRTALLEVLAAQAAISLDVARLYRDVEQREARIRRLVDANIVGIFIWEYGGGIREANDAFLRMVGYEREDLVAGRLHWTRLTPPEWRDRSAQAIDELKMTGIMQPYEKEYIRKDRSRVPVMIGSASFEDGSKQGVSFLLDLTELKRAEVLNAQVFESAPDGICIVGRDYRYRRANPVYSRRWGAPAERIVGMHVAELLGADVFERILKPRLDRCFAGEEVAFEWVAEARGGLFIAVSYSPLRSGSSEVEAALVIQRDITEYMRASESLRVAQAELAHVNRVTTMGELGASIAHEVNQPITGVLTNAQTARHLLARGEAGQEGIRRAIERIIRDATRAGDVIGRIRDLVKKAPPRRDNFDLNGAIRDVIELSRAEAVKNCVAVSARLEPGLPLVEGDRVQLQQVILNLTVNAVEAMSSISEGPRELLITSANAKENMILVTVQDSGPGLDRENLDRVFEAFYTTKPAGLGMGLSICRSIIAAHSGQLWASANVPRGAMFHFTLPGPRMTSPS